MEEQKKELFALQNNQGKDALYYLMKFGNDSVVSAFVNNIDSIYHKKKIPLLKYLYQKQPDKLVKVLSECKPDKLVKLLKQQDDSGETILHISAKAEGNEGQLQFIKTITEKLDLLMEEQKKELFALQNNQGKNALYYLTKFGEESVVSIFIKHDYVKIINGTEAIKNHQKQKNEITEFSQDSKKIQNILESKQCEENNFVTNKNNQQNKCEFNNEESVDLMKLKDTSPQISSNFSYCKDLKEAKKTAAISIKSTMPICKLPWEDGLGVKVSVLRNYLHHSKTIIQFLEKESIESFEKNIQKKQSEFSCESSTGDDCVNGIKEKNNQEIKEFCRNFQFYKESFSKEKQDHQAVQLYKDECSEILTTEQSNTSNDEL